MKKHRENTGNFVFIGAWQPCRVSSGRTDIKGIFIIIDPLLALERDLHTVHPLLMNTDDQIANSQTAKLLEQLGVKKLTASDVIRHHILPVLKDEMWKVIDLVQ